MTKRTKTTEAVFTAGRVSRLQRSSAVWSADARECYELACTKGDERMFALIAERQELSARVSEDARIELDLALGQAHKNQGVE